jgi:hypothetical protein
MNDNPDSTPLFQVVFNGELAPGIDRADAEKGIAKLFKASPAQVAQFFSGKRVVVKSGVNSQVARKYQLAFEKVGAVCSVEPMSSQPEDKGRSSSDKAASQKQETHQQAKSTSVMKPAALRLAPTGARLGPQRRVEKGPDVDKDHFELNPTGTQLSPENTAPVPEAPDVSHMTIAPVGSRLEDEKEDNDAFVPDISHLSIDAQTDDKK